jgi:hypothetical protein
LAEQLDDQLNQSIFTNRLAKALQDEPLFGTELARLLEEATRQSGDAISTGSGAVTTSGGTAGCRRRWGGGERGRTRWHPHRWIAKE